MKLNKFDPQKASTWPIFNSEILSENKHILVRETKPCGAEIWSLIPASEFDKRYSRSANTIEWEYFDPQLFDKIESLESILRFEQGERIVSECETGAYVECLNERIVSLEKGIQKIEETAFRALNKGDLSGRDALRWILQLAIYTFGLKQTFQRQIT